MTSLRWYGLEILRNIPGSRSSDVLDFRSSILKSFSVLVPTTEGDLASVHCKSTTQEKRPDQPHMEDVLFLPRWTWGRRYWGLSSVACRPEKFSFGIGFFFHSFIVTLLQGSCDFEHSTESGRLPSDVNSSLSVIMPSIAWLVILMRGSHWTCTRDFISYLDTGVLRRCASKEVFCSCGVHRADLEALKEEGEGGGGGGMALIGTRG